MSNLDPFLVVAMIGILSYMSYQGYMLWKEAHENEE